MQKCNFPSLVDKNGKAFLSNSIIQMPISPKEKVSCAYYLSAKTLLATFIGI